MLAKRSSYNFASIAHSCGTTALAAPTNMSTETKLLPHDDELETDLVHACLKFIHTESKSSEWHSLFWVHYRMQYLAKYLPQKAWRVILEIWSIHQCPEVMSSLSGVIRTLLLKHPIAMLPVIEAEAFRDHTFAKLLATLEQITLDDEIYAHIIAASQQRTRQGALNSQVQKISSHQVIRAEFMPNEEEKDEDLARVWLIAQQVEFRSERRETLFWTHERISYLTKYLPHKAWRVILLIREMDQSVRISQSLSAGEIENLLSRNGSEMIALVEAEAHRDPGFARLLAGVWRNRMTDEVWMRLQAVCDRRE